MIYRFGEFSIDTSLYELSCGDQVLRVEPLTFDLMVYLIEHRRRVVTRDELLDQLWPGKVVTDSALAARMKDARQAIGDSGERQQLIRTVRGRGYQFVAELDATIETPTDEIFDHIHAGDLLQLPSIPSVAVMPLDNLSGNPDDAYFSDGITDAIRHGLTRYRELFVMGRSSSFSLQQTPIDARQIGRKLGVKYLVQGSLRRHDNDLTITVELLDTLSARNLWSNSYHCKLREFFALEDEIVRTLVILLARRIENTAYREMQGRVPNDLDAWEWVLRGNRSFERGNSDDLVKAEERYRHAVALDPDISSAYTGLSNVLIFASWGQPSDQYRKMVQRSLAYGQKAVALDDQDSRAHYAVGHAYICLGEHDMAEFHADQALALNPAEYHNLCFKGYLLACTGRHEESESFFSQSIRRNPLSPKSCYCGVGLSRYLASRYDDATPMLNRLSGFSYVQHKLTGLAAAHAQLGNEGRAIEVLRKYYTRLDPALTAELGNEITRWQAHMSNLYSFLKPDDLEHLLEGLRKAGLSV